MPQSEETYFIDQTIAFEFVPEFDQTTVPFRVYLVRLEDRERILWGEQTQGAAAGETISLPNRLVDLMDSQGANLTAGQYIKQWQYVDGNGQENTFDESHVTFKSPAHMQ